MTLDLKVRPVVTTAVLYSQCLHHTTMTYPRCHLVITLTCCVSTGEPDEDHLWLRQIWDIQVLIGGTVIRLLIMNLDQIISSSSHPVTTCIRSKLHPAEDEPSDYEGWSLMTIDGSCVGTSSMDRVCLSVSLCNPAWLHDAEIRTLDPDFGVDLNWSLACFGLSEDFDLIWTGHQCSMLLSAGGVALQTKTVGAWTNWKQSGWFCCRQKTRPSKCCGGATDEEEIIFCFGE